MFKKKEGLLIAGMVCIFFAIIFKYSFDETGLTDFLQGVFMGLSIVFNISYLIKIRVSRTSSHGIKFAENSLNQFFVLNCPNSINISGSSSFWVGRVASRLGCFRPNPFSMTMEG